MQKKNLKRKTLLKEDKGITLITLIITVIVLLILAGVTISLTIGENGIFKTAQTATRNYTNAQEKELADLAEFNNTLNDTIKGEEKVQLVTEITLNKTETTIGIGSTETLIATIRPTNSSNKNLTWTSSNIDIASVSDGTITAIALGTTTITVTIEDGSGKSASCNVTVEYPTLASKARLGDYVEYDGGNGYTGKWQVLYNDSTYGLQIISSNTVKDSYSLNGIGGYNSAVNALNTECRKYINSLYATSGRCVGSNPLSPDDDTVSDTTDGNYTTDYNAMQAATSRNTSGIHAIGKVYWLASRYYYPVNFTVRCVNANGDPDNRVLHWTVYPAGYSYDAEHAAGVRSVVTLVSGIQTSSGDGSETNAYKLVAQ